MRATVVLAHPYAESFNHALFHRAVQTLQALDAEVFAHDLYAEKFDPVLTVAELGKEPSTDPLVRQYTAELMASDVLVFVHPNWWGRPPALLAGYIDRIIRPPHAYEVSEGKLGGKLGVVFNTGNTPAERENDYFGDPLEALWKRCLFGFCGIEDTRRVLFRVVSDSTPAIRRTWLDEAESTLREVVTHFPKRP
ncbi:MAG: NAD(P)H-dependent oxidoreductase [Spirochaetales bacterium]